MILSSPIWLVLLAPWIALLLWLLRGEFETHSVPFLSLWKRDVFHDHRLSRSLRWPPLAITALLTATLLAIFAATGPRIEPKDNPQDSSARSARDVKLLSLSVRDWPTIQAMVCISNQSDLRSAHLTVKSGPVAVGRDIVLPASGISQNFFIDLPAADSKVLAEISTPVSVHHLEAQLESHWPIVESHSLLPAPLGRMIEVYSRDRKGGLNSNHILVTSNTDLTPPTEPTAIVPAPNQNDRAIDLASGLLIADSPITRKINWSRALRNATASPAPGSSWQPLISAGDIIIVATRQTPMKEVWVGFNAADFPRNPDFVLFWNGIFNWLGDADWETQITQTHETEEPSPTKPQKTAFPMSPPLLLAAVGMVLVAAMTWRNAATTRPETSKS